LPFLTLCLNYLLIFGTSIAVLYGKINQLPKEETMRNWRKTLEKTFMAVSFAEAGEHQTAAALAGIKPNWDWVEKVSKAVENIFAAVTFAEADCPEAALGFIGPKASRRPQQSLEDFLKNVGLQGIQVRYAVVSMG
jgi:hypothetical protein